MRVAEDRVSSGIATAEGQRQTRRKPRCLPEAVPVVEVREQRVAQRVAQALGVGALKRPTCSRGGGGGGVHCDPCGVSERGAVSGGATHGESCNPHRLCARDRPAPPPSTRTRNPRHQHPPVPVLS